MTSILESDDVAALVRLLEEATRSTKEGVRRFTEPASGTLSRSVSRQHHLVFGRRGSGKSSLLRKAAADLTVDRRPIAFVDLETFKGHAYPDVLLSVLIETFDKFAVWLETAAVHPSTKASFWNSLFGKKPTRGAFNKNQAQILAGDLRSEINKLQLLLHREETINVQVTGKDRNSTSTESNIRASLGTGTLTAKVGEDKSKESEASNETITKYVDQKVNHLHRHIMDYQSIFRRIGDLSKGDSFLFLDDLYHIRRKDQAQVVDYFHRIAKGNSLWIKVGTIRHRTQWYINGDPPVGTKIGDDISEINLDSTLEKYSLTRSFLGKVMDTFLQEGKLKRVDIMTEGALERLVLASGGVARDFIGLLRGSILVAKDRGDSARRGSVGVEDVNGAAGEYDSSKREELTRDTIDESQALLGELVAIGRFVKETSNANVFLVEKGIPENEMEPLEELVDLRLIHRVRSRVTMGVRPGKVFEAFMLDVSQYTAARKKRGLEMIEFWKEGNVESLRKANLIYKESKK